MACFKLFYKFMHDNFPDCFLLMFSTRDNLRPRRIVRVPQCLITDDIIVQNDLFRIEVTHTNLMCSSLYKTRYSKIITRNIFTNNGT